MTSSTIFVAVIFILLLTVADAKTDTVPVTYLSYVDNAYGFYKVIDLTTHKASPYDNRILIINQGDTVTWMNDADTVLLTVVSEQKLFGDKRLDIRQRSSHTFDQIGTYTFYIKEYSSRRQTVIVNAIGEDISPTQITAPTAISTYIATPTPTIIPTINVPVYVTNTPTPITTITNIPIPVITDTPSPPYDPPSMTQFMSIVVAILSILITYEVGKDSKEYKGEYKKTEEVKIKNEEKSSYGIKFGQKISGVLCYLLGFLSGIIFLMLSQKDNRFVRFHAIQSILTFLSLSMILLILMEIPSIGDIFGPLLIMISPILWILLMIKAYQGKMYKLPIIGNVAERRS